MTVSRETSSNNSRRCKCGMVCRPGQRNCLPCAAVASKRYRQRRAKQRAAEHRMAYARMAARCREEDLALRRDNPTPPENA